MRPLNSLSRHNKNAAKKARGKSFARARARSCRCVKIFRIVKVENGRRLSLVRLADCEVADARARGERPTQTSHIMRAPETREKSAENVRLIIGEQRRASIRRRAMHSEQTKKRRRSERQQLGAGHRAVQKNWSRARDAQDAARS